MKPLKWYKSLQTTKGRRENLAFLVEGRRAISQIVSRCPSNVTELLTDRGEEAEKFENIPLRILSSTQMGRIASSKTPQGLLAVVKLLPETCSSILPPAAGSRIVLLEHIQDAGNVGTLIRSAAAFGFDGIIMSDKCADAFSPKAVQASAGSILSVWIRRSVDYLDMISTFKKRGYIIAATGVKGKKLSEINHGLVLCMGNEAKGLSSKLLNMADRYILIPIDSARVESLNVAAAGAVCMYSISQGKFTI